MAGMVRRSRELQALLWIRNGPGAIVLPKEVTRLALEFHVKTSGGHRGPKMFWREMLPRIKYRNPTVAMSVSRHDDPAGPALLHIWSKTVSPSSPSDSTPSAQPADPATSPTTTTPIPINATTDPPTDLPTQTIPIKDLPESEILTLLIEATGATPLETSPEDAQAMEDNKALRERSDKDRALMKEHFTKVRREEALLKAARGEKVGALA